ncbi:MAG: dTMP kinase [Treponema sp.]|jgi:dTMP kinase|nr:dTMP kinase [Treponema sp.]
MEFIPNFAVFEGGDGSGTTTQLSILAERFKNTPKPVFFRTFEPTNEKTGLLIRSALKNEIKLRAETLCFLFAADRNEHLYGTNGIITHTKRNELVVSDRYTLSSLVYQGIECGDELPQALNSCFPAPELTIFFDIVPEIALERIKNRSSHEIYENLNFQKKAREKYMDLLKNYDKAGGKVEIINSSGHVQEVADKVWSIISQMPILKNSENIF